MSADDQRWISAMNAAHFRPGSVIIFRGEGGMQRGIVVQSDPLALRVLVGMIELVPPG